MFKLFLQLFVTVLGIYVLIIGFGVVIMVYSTVEYTERKNNETFLITNQVNKNTTAIIDLESTVYAY